VALSVFGCALLAGATVAWAQTSASAGPAQELAGILEAGQMGAIAAQHPTEPDRFVAALYFPGTLLVVSARYSAPQLLETRLEMKEYREIYVELNGAALPDSKIFVQDVGADGLLSARDNADGFERGDRNWIFNRNWRDQSLAEAEYEKNYQDADVEYATMLNALLGQAKS
jgi:hypothetical protein